LQAAYFAVCYMNGICDDRGYKYGKDKICMIFSKKLRIKCIGTNSLKALE